MRVLALLVCLCALAGCVIADAPALHVPPDDVPDATYDGHPPAEEPEPEEDDAAEDEQPPPEDEYPPAEDEHPPHEDEPPYEPNDLDTTDDDAEHTGHADIIANGIPILYASFHIPDGELFPTHVPLLPIAEAFGEEVFWDVQTDQVSLYGLLGEIFFVVGEIGYMVGGTFVDDDLPTLVLEGELLVPFTFFSRAFGATNVYFSGGTIFIYSEGDLE